MRKTLALAAFAALVATTLPADAQCVMHDGVCHSSVALAMQYGYVPPATAGVYAQVGVRAGGYADPRRGKPKCATRGHEFDRELGKCVGPRHEIELTPAQKDILASCGEIETREIRRGTRIVEQQRCKP